MPNDVLLVVTATVAPEGHHARGPRKDYSVIASRLQADVLDHTAVRTTSRATRLIARFFGIAVAQAWLAFRRRHLYAAIVTDGEHIGIPLALLLKIAGDRRVHVTIGHRLTAAKKRPFFRRLRVHTHTDFLALHSRRQYELAVADLGIPAERLALVPYQVDTEFWRPQAGPEERIIASAGLEFRDYPTLLEAVDGLDVEVVIGAASHWSKRRNTARGVTRPSNVHVDKFDYVSLRDVYARSAMVVVPLDEIDFQAGITTVLEAMAMAKPVIVTHTSGQTDVVQDRRRFTRGDQPRPRPESFLRAYANQAGIALEPTGFYVPPNDPDALRRAIAHLLDHADERQRLGAAGRRTVERLTTVEQFAERLAALVNQARARHQSTVTSPGRRSTRAAGVN